MYDPLNVVTVGFYGTAEKQQWDCSDSTVALLNLKSVLVYLSRLVHNQVIFEHPNQASSAHEVNSH
mgnify:CR=1|jgi:hypothetical protein